ncbi:hypothetical protein BU24DRAFT_151604 [Aaosphaeria arxii CBS 175.79]|uniref:Luciferase domain-containing protein n=1 Tax=Aaosphaeria arxii CBS 175.79 TaxID=1450172 RepID=A0A6A5XVX2_9PLEO|nr:uncharacterized protein BU24DRAFT_151604 [Aaosphaeria arxii CBS 175.79]KAF2017468.1 hypothetical protein BU24DRAFT_151604 [Aaosphaeria arxii CBS 175.79]
MASEHLRTVIDVLKAHRFATASVLGLAAISPWAIRDYRLFLSYGPGGLPYNPLGWLVANIFNLISREQLSTTVYSHRGFPLDDEPGFLPAGFPQKRASPRPLFGAHAVPQRQLDQLPTEAIRQSLIDRFAELGQQTQEKGLTEVKQSLLERRHDAIHVSKKRQWHALADQTRGEISHVHAGLDGSLHVTLHPSDCKAVIEAGWGQRHPLSGVRLLQTLLGLSLPISYVVIYAPRDEAEIEIAITIVKASIEYMTSARGALE